MFDRYGIYVPAFAGVAAAGDGVSVGQSFGPALCEYYRAVRAVAEKLGCGCGSESVCVAEDAGGDAQKLGYASSVWWRCCGHRCGVRAVDGAAFGDGCGQTRVEGGVGVGGNVDGVYCGVRASDLRDTESSGSSCSGGLESQVPSTECERGVDVGGNARVVGVEQLSPGKHAVRNRKRKDRAAKERKMAGSWRSQGSVCTVRTVDTRTAEEIEAVRTLALRRSAENRVAEQIAKHRLTSLTDEKKTQAVRELQVQRMNANINAAKAKSQACYAKCDNSLKSLGSAGSAGEFAWKKTEADLAASREEVKNLRTQMDRALAVGGPEIFAAVAEVPEPKKYGIRDVLGEPGANWTEEEIEAYYDILNAEAIGNYSTNWEAQFPRSFWDRKAKENF